MFTCNFNLFYIDKYPHHEEKIVYENPHEHHEHDYGGYPGGYGNSKSYESYPPGKFDII